MFKPMLAGSVKELPVRFPVLASPKLDGERATIQEDKFVSRNLKPIGNLYTRLRFSDPEFEGLDGEMILGDPTAPDAFRKTASATGSMLGEPDVTFWVFDMFKEGMPFVQRLELARYMVGQFNLKYKIPFNAGGMRIVPHVLVHTQEALSSWEEKWLNDGYEGVMLRDPNGPYKQGRSTEREGWLLKLKRFVDGEGEVIQFIEQMTNLNPATINALWHTERSSHKANKVPAGTLGSIEVKNLQTGVVHRISPGSLTAVEGKQLWESREQYVGKIAKFKYFPTGSKDKPRFGEFCGFRNQDDL